MENIYSCRLSQSRHGYRAGWSPRSAFVMVELIAPVSVQHLL